MHYSFPIADADWELAFRTVIKTTELTISSFDSIFVVHIKTEYCSGKYSIFSPGYTSRSEKPMYQQLQVIHNMLLGVLYHLLDREEAMCDKGGMTTLILV